MCCVCTILSRDYICMLLSFGIDCCACSVHLYKHFQTFIPSMFYRYAHFGDTKTWTTECIPKNILNGWEYMFFFFVLLAWAALRNKSQCLLFQCMFVQQEKAIDNILGRFLPIPKLRRVCAWIPWIRFIFNDSHKSSGKGNPCKMMSSSIHTIQFFKMKMSSLEMPFRKCDGE